MTKRYRLDLGSIIDNQTGTILSEIQVRNRLNELTEKNQRLSKDKQIAETEIIRIRQTLKDAIRTERTNIGKSVLKQLKEQIE